MKCSVFVLHIKKKLNCGPCPRSSVRLFVCSVLCGLVISSHLRLTIDCLHACTLRLSDRLLLSVLQMILALSAKAFSVSAPSVWNSLSYNCRSAELLSTFKHNLKTKVFDIA